MDAQEIINSRKETAAAFVSGIIDIFNKEIEELAEKQKTADKREFALLTDRINVVRERRNKTMNIWYGIRSI